MAGSAEDPLATSPTPPGIAAKPLHASAQSHTIQGMTLYGPRGVRPRLAHEHPHHGHNLGRALRLLLDAGGKETQWRGTPARLTVITKAITVEPDKRLPNVSALADAWHAAGNPRTNGRDAQQRQGRHRLLFAGPHAALRRHDQLGVQPFPGSEDSLVSAGGKMGVPLCRVVALVAE